jgi:hypothetical protein
MKTLLFAIIALTAISALATETNGIERGNGGDEISQEFVLIGYELVESLQRDPIAGIHAEKLFQAVQNTKVISTSQKLILRGQEVSAINDPSALPPRITINQQAWQEMNESSHKKVFLAFHEYLGILGIDDSNYQISSLLDRAKVCDRHPAIRTDIEEELKKSCYRIIPDDLRYVDDIGPFLPNEINHANERSFSGLNLGALRLGNQTLQNLNLELIGKNSKLFFLDLGASFSDLSTCSFLIGKPKLDTIWLSDSGYDRNFKFFRPIQKIAARCFENLNLGHLIVALDGKHTQYKHFLKGIKSVRSLQIDGLNINSIPPEEFSEVNVKHLALTSYDRSIDESYAQKVEAATGMKCYPGQIYENYRKDSLEFNCERK